MHINVKGPDTREIEGYLKGLEPAVFSIVKGGTKDWVLRAHRASKANLSGSGSDAPGSYPVPVRTGNTRRSEDYVLPGTSKHGLSAGPLDGFLVNTAAGAGVIHDGTHTQRAFGPRPFQLDAVEDTRDDVMSGMLVNIRREVVQ